MSATGQNEVSHAASTYLLQHANLLRHAKNPVHWRMRGEAALREAQARHLLPRLIGSCAWAWIVHAEGRRALRHDDWVQESHAGSRNASSRPTLLEENLTAV